MSKELAALIKTYRREAANALNLYAQAIIDGRFKTLTIAELEVRRKGAYDLLVMNDEQWVEWLGKNRQGRGGL